MKRASGAPPMRDLRITSTRLALVTWVALAAVLRGVVSTRTKDGVVSLNGIQGLNDGWLMREAIGLATQAGQGREVAILHNTSAANFGHTTGHKQHSQNSTAASHTPLRAEWPWQSHTPTQRSSRHSYT